MTLFFRVMRFFIGIYLITGPFRESPAASNGGPQPRAQRSGSGGERKKIPLPDWAPPPSGDFGQPAAAERRKQGKMGKGPVWPPCGRPPNREPSGAGRGWKRRNSLSG